MKTTVESIIKNLFLLLLSIGLFTTLSFAQNDGQVMSKNNLKIFVQYKLIKKNLLTNDNIQVDVTGNQIILSGTVPTLYDKNEAEVEAHSVDENYIVVNNLTVERPDIADSVLTKTVLDKIQSNLFYGVFDWINASSDNGVVTLKGWVHLPWLKTQFQNEVAKISGVESINNEIKNTFGPGEIGIRAARLIYNDPMFWGMQYFANPPIHIIVNNSSVILEGNVNSQVQSSWAENLVRFHTDAFSVENDLKVQE
ncbi:BON domain-containing protein [bacterium BMS3Abin03]|nr:BON domain-containing protein [bacterium BMS3Abin03]